MLQYSNGISLIILFLSLKLHSLTVVTMKGGEFITWDIRQNSIEVKSLRIVFKFRTVDPSGLILFSSNQEYGDFISVELIDGHVRYKSQLGLFENEQQEIVLGNNLNNYKWHVVDIKLNETNSSLEILGVGKKENTVVGDFKRLDLDDKVYFGGVPDDIDVQPFKITKRKFSGCLENLLFNDTDILYQAKYSRPKFSIDGDVLWKKCQDLNYFPISFPNPQDFALVPTQLTSNMNVVFKFRTHIGDGLLFSKISTLITVYLILQRGELIYKVQIHGQGPLIMKRGKNLHDGFWHRVEILVTKKTMNLKLDKLAELTHESPWGHLVEFDVGNATIGGGAEHITKGFTGCVYDVWIDDTEVYYPKLGKEFLQGAVFGCNIKDRCLFSPCQNGGKCVQDHKSLSCDCKHTFYDGTFCEKSIHQPSCQEYKDIGLKEDAHCLIDPDGNGKLKPIKVLCNMTKYSKKAVTVFTHDMGWKETAVKKGILKEGFFLHYLMYGASMETFGILLKSAVSCKQYIQYRCRNSFLMGIQNGPTVTKWIGRPGSFEQYWGGAKPDSGMCACFTNRSCADKYRFCNCDLGDDVWREDSGYFQEIDRLPVFELMFKQNANNQSYFTVGNLECEYNTQKDTSKLERIRVLKACKPLNDVRTTESLYTYPRLKQEEHVISFKRQKPHISHEVKPATKIIVNKPLIPNVNVNVTFELPNSKNDEKTESGFKLTISVYAIIVIAVCTFTVTLIIAIVVLYRRRNRRRSRRRNRNHDDLDADIQTDESSEMCTFFGSLSTRSSCDRDRPVLEVHRHSIHCDALEDILPAYRQYTDYHQPIHTHIDLSYKSRKKGIFC